MGKEFATTPRKDNLKVLYKKLTLANLLNWFAVRSLHAYSKICGQLILYAINLDPSREVFKRNLNDLNRKQVPFHGKKRNLKFCTFSDANKYNHEEVTFFYTNKAISLSKPKVFNSNITVTDRYACTAYLPDAYLSVIKDAQVFAGTDLIIVDNIAIYDEMDKEELNQAAIKSPVISSVKADEITINLPKIKKHIKKGIHLTKDHSANYFHWLVECLPKLSLVTDLDRNIPLLVDDFLPVQAYDALNMLNSKKREIIKIKKEESYIVKKLYYPSRMSIIRDNYGMPVYNKDVVYSAKGIQFVRNSILTAANSENEPTRKIFVSRKNSSYRQLLNSVEVEDLLISRGFEIVFPENLSFLSQVNIFSQAEIIIGQSGAGMANIIFAPKTAKVLMMLSDIPESNLQVFNALAETVDISLEYLIGTAISTLKKYSVHSDFYIDINLLENYLDKKGY